MPTRLSSCSGQPSTTRRWAFCSGRPSPTRRLTFCSGRPSPTRRFVHESSGFDKRRSTRLGLEVYLNEARILHNNISRPLKNYVREHAFRIFYFGYLWRIITLFTPLAAAPPYRCVYIPVFLSFVEECTLELQLCRMKSLI